MAKRGSQILVLLISFITWILLTWRLDPNTLMVGFIFSLIGAFKFGELFTELPHKFLEPRRYLWFIYFIPIFLYEMVKANLDVARRVLDPALPINPGLVKIKTTLKNDLAKTVLALALTLTPGTTTVDIHEDELFIHWIDVKTTDPEAAAKMISGKYEKYLARVFE
jgi:multicomponent Na+:H+ antiporter subunit E